MEFRTVVRTNLSVKADNKEIDSYFGSLDGDSSGSLDLVELKNALKSLQDAEVQAASDAAHLRERAEAVQKKADAVKEVAEATLLVEDADKRLVALRSTAAIDAKIGEIILKRNLKIGDLITTWDKNGDGDVSKVLSSPPQSLCCAECG